MNTILLWVVNVAFIFKDNYCSKLFLVHVGRLRSELKYVKSSAANIYANRMKLALMHRSHFWPTCTYRTF